MTQLALLSLALTLSAADPTLDAQVETASVQTVQDEGGATAAAPDEPGFLEKYYPLTFADNLEPEVDENFVLLYALASLGWGVWGGVWGPLVLIGNAEDMFIDLLISEIIHLVPLFIPVVSCVMLPATILYLQPVATINIADRNLKIAKKNGTWKAAKNAVSSPSADELAMAQMAF